MIRRFVAIAVASTLAITGVLAYTSAWNDAAIVDEDPHIGAGISYLTQRDMRINPEHPPLVKDLAALPLLAIPDLVIPTDHSSWTDDINGQWDFGRAFLFQSGNNADTILRLARIAPVLIMLLLGWFVFRWTRERAGVAAGFFALLFYVSSPVVLAHGRFVTTDVPAAVGVFIATYFFLRYLQAPNPRNLLLAGVVFGFAQLTKFSAVLLVPYFGVLALLWGILQTLRARGEGVSERSPDSPPSLVRSLTRYLGGTVLVGLIGTFVIYIVYIFHLVGYPVERQLRDTEHILSSFPNQTIARAIVHMAGITALRPIAQYLLGLAMVVQRATGGNTTFFLGEVSAAGWRSYFPIVYLIKMPLAFHFFTLIAVVSGIKTFSTALRANMYRVGIGMRSVLPFLTQLLRTRFSEFAMVFFIVLYWYTSLTSNLNIGVRHLLPTFPFLFVLVAMGIRSFLRNPRFFVRGASLSAVSRLAQRWVFVSILFTWLIIAGLLAPWPSYLSSFNEIAASRGGRENWAVDSNLDWGQDLKRLARFVETRDIDRISVDYFGWTPPEYYIKSAEVVPWSVDQGQPEGWFAVSATYRQQACAQPAKGFDRDTTGYCFLKLFEPETTIGGSIYVYNLPELAR